MSSRPRMWEAEHADSFAPLESTGGDLPILYNRDRGAAVTLWLSGMNRGATAHAGHGQLRVFDRDSLRRQGEAGSSGRRETKHAANPAL